MNAKSFGQTLILTLLFLTGCVTSQEIVTGTKRAPIDPAQVKIYATPPNGAEEVALLSVDSAGKSQSAMNLAIDTLKKKAAMLGANGIVVLASGTEQHTSGSFGTYNPSLGLFSSSTSSSDHTKVQAKAFYIEEAR